MFIRFFGFLLLSLNVHWLHAAPPLGEKFAFTAKPFPKAFPPLPPMKFVNREDSLIINCTTNDPDATVTLTVRQSTFQPFQNALPKFGDRMMVSEQTFIIPKLATSDTFYYKCDASNKKDPAIELTLGQLIVSATVLVRDPEIYPNDPVIKIETNGNFNVTCKSIGKITAKESYLTWYRNVNNKLELIDPSKISRLEEKTTDGNAIDIEILMFKNFKKDDVGTYVCQRQVSSTSTPTKKSVDIDFEPNISPKISFPDLVSGNFISVSEKERVTIRCSVGGSPRPKKSWEKDGKTILTCVNEFDDECILTLLSAKHDEHSGVYSCVAENIVKKVKKSVTLEVRVPPVIEKPTTTIVASTDDDYEVDCKVVAANPNPTFQWFQQPETCDPKAVQSCIPLESDWSLVQTQTPAQNIPTNVSYIVAEKTITNFFYRCSAKNAEGTDSYTFSLVRKEQAIPQFSILPKTSPYTINELDKLEVKCASDIFLYQSVELSRDSSILQSKQTIVNNTRYTTFMVDQAQLSDAGTYECKGELKRGGSRSDSLKVVVKKLEPPVITNFDDQVISQDLVNNYEMRCDVTGNPAPKISWRFNGKQLKNSATLDDIKSCNFSTPGIYHLRDKPNKIVLCKVDYKQHEGEYECISSNIVSTETEKRNLTIEAKPEIINWSPTVNVALSDTSDLECLSEANPPANVTWYRVDNTTKKVELLSSKMVADVLTLGNIQKETAGLYKCTANSRLGEVSKHVEVIVKGSAGPLVSMTDPKTITGVVVGAIVILIIGVIILFWYKRKLKKRYALFLEPNENFVLDPDRSLFDQSSELPYDMAWEFPRERLTFIKTLGSGAFGQVWLAEAEGINSFLPRDKSSSAMKRRKSIQKQRRRYHSISIRYRKQLNTEETTLEKTMVAVKTLKEDAAEEEYKDLASELKILIHLGEHKNIVNILGACTTKGKLCVMLECCPHGNLLNFLRSKRDIFQPIWEKHETDMENEFTYIDLIMIVFQVARGMDFLQSRKTVHRDLAARNVLVGEDYIVKIADFGLARDIYKDEFYLKQTTGLLPVKWMAPESLFDKVYTSMSDAWSYGIVLWEVFTLGGSPYPGLPTEDLFSFLQEGKTMNQPDICPDDVYEIMKGCWRKSPYERPIFAHIVEQLSNIMKQNVQNADNEYLDFTDAPNDDYLEPSVNDDMKKAPSNEYLEASEHYSTKGHTYVPAPSNGYADEMSNTPLPDLPNQQSTGYVPMTPADHYKSPQSFRYDAGQEAIV